MADLNALAVFAKVVSAGSFSEAARRLKMPISTVSRRISELEDQLGVRLIERSTRNLRLTDLGAEVLEHAVRNAELSEAVESIVSNRLADVSGTLHLSAMPSVSDTLLTPLVTAFQDSYPNVRVHILVTERMVDLIAEGFDLAFRLGPLKDSRLVARRILTYRHRLVASPSYLKGRIASEAARLARAPAPGLLLLEAGEQLDLPAQEREGPGDIDLRALPLDERLLRLGACAGRRSRYRRASSGRPADTRRGRPPR